MENMLWMEYKEKADHGTVLLPMRHYRCLVPYAYRELSMHWHEEVEMTMILEGSIDYSIDLLPYQVQAGDLLLISPHILHSAHEIPGQGMLSETLVFHLDFLGLESPDACTIRYVAPIQGGSARLQPILHSTDRGYKELADCFLSMTEIYKEKREGYELWLKQKLFTMMALLYQNGYIVKADREDRGGEAEEKLKRVLAYIREHYQRPLTIQELAGVCHFSQVHFMNFFKKLVGMTCVEYINRYRVEMAARCLASTQVTITEAAMENGFHNISYFNKMFKAAYQMTPSQYRRQIGRGTQARTPDESGQNGADSDPGPREKS